MGKMMKQLARRQAKEKAKSEARAFVLNEYEDFCSKMDIALAYTLHQDFGFGKKRLESFFRRWVENQKTMIADFRLGNDDGHYYAMNYRLKNYYGIDVNEITTAIANELFPEDKNGRIEVD